MYLYPAGFLKTNLENFACQLMGKGPKGSFFAFDDKVENHINEGEGKKNGKSEENEREERREQPRPRAFPPIFRRQNPRAKVGEEKKTRVALLVFILAIFLATFSKIQLDPAH